VLRNRMGESEYHLKLSGGTISNCKASTILRTWGRVSINVLVYRGPGCVLAFQFRFELRAQECDQGTGTRSGAAQT